MVALPELVPLLSDALVAPELPVFWVEIALSRFARSADSASLVPDVVLLDALLSVPLVEVELPLAEAVPLSRSAISWCNAPVTPDILEPSALADPPPGGGPGGGPGGTPEASLLPEKPVEADVWFD